MVLPRKQYLLERFSELLRDSGADERTVAQGAELIETSYQESQRHYHTLAHIGLSLAVLDRIEHMAHDKRALHFALWFHDVVYQPLAPLNKWRSAEVAANFIEQMGLPPVEIERVRSLILVTRDHIADLGDIDAQIMIDCDLAVLGSEPSVYEWYQQSVRKELQLLPDSMFRALRRRRLRSYLARDSIYSTSIMAIEREGIARDNIGRELGIRRSWPVPSRAA